MAMEATVRWVVRNNRFQPLVTLRNTNFQARQARRQAALRKQLDREKADGDWFVNRVIEAGGHACRLGSQAFKASCRARNQIVREAARRGLIR